MPTGEHSDQLTEASDLLAAIRREHIRVRMQIITLYEERLRESRRAC